MGAIKKKKVGGCEIFFVRTKWRPRVVRVHGNILSGKQHGSGVWGGRCFSCRIFLLPFFPPFVVCVEILVPQGQCL